jgi:hypothetical protein
VSTSSQKRSVPGLPLGTALATVSLAFTLLAHPSFASPSTSPSASTETSEMRAAARRELDLGNEAFEKGAYAAALAAYRRAHAFVPSPNLLFNLAQAHRNLGQNVEAAALYQRFLTEATQAPANVRQEAEGHLQTLDAQLARLVVVVTRNGSAALSRDVELTLDGQSREEDEFPSILRVLPGSHVVAARTRPDGLWVGERVVVRAGDIRQVSFALAATPSGPSSPARPPESASTGSVAVSSPVERVEAVSPRPSSTSSFGASLRADLSASLEGAGWTAAATWAPGAHLNVRAGGLVWPAQGHPVFGALLGVRLVPWSTLISPFAEIEAMIYRHDGPHPGGRAAVGLAWNASRHLSFSAGMAFFRLSRGSSSAAQESQPGPSPETSFWSPFLEAALP